MTVLMNPDCLNGAHRACSTTGWCESTDQAVPCPCVCHRLDVPPTEVYKTAPDGLNELLGYPGVPLNRLSEHSINIMATRDDPPRADGQHYDGCPCPPCVTIRAAQPTHTAMQAKHLSGASIGKLVQYSNGRSVTTNEHLWSPAAVLDCVNHSARQVELHIDYDTTSTGWTIDQIELDPNDWVLVTQPEGATA